LKAFLPLLRLHQPTGALLLFLPALWGLNAGGEARGGPDVFLVFLFAAGALSMRGAGCIYNDIVDRDLDSLVVRTQSRPLSIGQISPRQALF